MSSASNCLYVIREAQSTSWFELVGRDDALLLVEDGLFRSPDQLPQATQIFALQSDALARAVVPEFAQFIDHDAWVTLCCNFSTMVRL